MFAQLGCSILAIAASSTAPQGLSSNPNPAPADGPSISSRSFGAGNCNVIDFEGLADNEPVGTVLGTPNVTFGPSWLGLIDFDAGGTGNFANEPSADTITYFLTPADPIDFSSGVQSIQIFYVASAISVPVTLTAYDGPGGTGAVVDSEVGNTVGTSADGANCTGDPNGGFCLFDSITLTSSTNNILSVVLSGATANQFGFDNMTFCVTPPVTFYCTAKTNSQGCLPAMFSSGAPSASSATVFNLGATNVLNNKLATLVYGYASQAVPFNGGTLCVTNHIKRMPAVNTGGNVPPNDCSGQPVVDFNTTIQGGSDPLLVPGTTVYTQYFYRDPPDAFHWGLTDGASFVINP